ncbi:hypothetical protein YC2023_038668 [Brassica napus]
MIVRETNKSVEITLNDVSRLEDKKLLLIEMIYATEGMVLTTRRIEIPEMKFA